MKALILSLILFIMSINPKTIVYKFTEESNPKEWRVVNDGVMGGVSQSNFKLNEFGQGLFSGRVSLENFGGFASVQHETKIFLNGDKSHIVLRIKGDGKPYEFRIKGSPNQRYYYVHPFKTSGQWEVIKLPLNEFYPQFRGQKLNQANFNHSAISQLCFLIANKKEEDFELVIDWIGLE
jgi:NADH dehydrogenase [ubiquinone] 1 alpha subcomplex assembly factor 1